MVLESLIPAKKLYNHPINMIIISFIISLVCMAVSYFIFPSYAGVVAPLLITVAMAPVMHGVFVIEEELEEDQAKKRIKKTFIDRYDELIKIFAWFFIGNLIAVMVMMYALPESMTSIIFSQQIQEIGAIRDLGSSVTGAALSGNFLSVIIANNLKVMAFSFLLAFLIETGGLFILSWNASILGVFLGDFLRKGMASQLLLITAGILPHAIIEILAYFLAGISGGILSLGLVKTKPMSPEFKLILKDSLILLGGALLLIFLGGFVEVFL